VVAPSIGTRLRAAMTEQGSSYTKLIAAMRRVAEVEGETLPETRSLVTTLSRWFNDHERPGEFYQDILCRALSKSRVQLGFEDHSHPEDEGGAEPEDLARVLEASNVGPLLIGQMEAKLARRGEELPSTPPVLLRRPLLDDYRRVTAWLGGHSRLPNVVGSTPWPPSWPGWLERCSLTCTTLPGRGVLPRSVEGGWRSRRRRRGSVGAANISYLQAHRGAMPAALQAIQGAVVRAARCADVTTQHAWLAALEAELHSGGGGPEIQPASLPRGQDDRGVQHPSPRRG
jgi:hypothetical protein